MARQIEIQKVKSGYIAFVDGAILKKSNGVGKTFKTEGAARAAAQKVLDEAQGRPDPDRPLTTNQMVAMFAEVLGSSTALHTNVARVA